MSNVAVDLFSAFATDKSAERKGKLLLIPGCGDTKFLIARAHPSNAAYAAMATKLYKRNKQVIESGGQAAADANAEVMAETMSRTILLGWEGEINYKGKMCAYSQPLAKEMLLHADFRQAVTEVAESKDAFLLEEQAESEGN